MVQRSVKLYDDESVRDNPDNEEGEGGGDSEGGEDSLDRGRRREGARDDDHDPLNRPSIYTSSICGWLLQVFPANKQTTGPNIGMVHPNRACRGRIEVRMWLENQPPTQ